MPKEISYGAVIFRREGKEVLYLLLYRNAHEHYKEMWDFPRGLIEKGETPGDDIKREVKEETGIEDIKFIKGFKEKVKWFYKKEGQTIFKEATYYLAETKNKEVKISFEHDDFRWCNFEDALKLIKFSNTKNVLKKANEFLTGGLNKFI
ncbi:NUDIX domain-containing protein [Candidatus Woesearchaeota archaeon]|nr:NUDIX domain-containing protein [Candidatus Woesearchaeota archaeon]